MPGWRDELDNMMGRKPLRLPRIARDPLGTTREVLKASSARGAFAARATTDTSLPTTLTNVSNANHSREALWNLEPAPLTRTYILTLQKAEDYGRRQTVREADRASKKLQGIFEELSLLTEAFQECVTDLESETMFERNDILASEKLMFRKLKKTIRKIMATAREAEIYSPVCPHLSHDSAQYLDYGVTDGLTVRLLWVSSGMLDVRVLVQDERGSVLPRTYLTERSETNRDETIHEFHLDLPQAEMDYGVSLQFYISGLGLNKLKYGWLIFSDVFGGPPRHAKEIPATLADQVQLVSLTKRGPSWTIRGTQDLIFDKSQLPVKDRFYTSSWCDLEALFRNLLLQEENIMYNYLISECNC